MVFLDRDRDALPSLLQFLSIESTAVEWLISDPDSFDWLRMSAGQIVDAGHLKDILACEIQNLDDEEQILASYETVSSTRVVASDRSHFVYKICRLESLHNNCLG